MSSKPPPEISLAQLFTESGGVEGEWRIGWRVQNKGAAPLKINSLRLPHGQFKSEERVFQPTLDLDRGQGAQFETLVRCHEPPGLVTENAFVIFHVDWLGEPWRIFVRVRVTVNSNGEPGATIELITTQQVGFSGLAE